jgi:PKD repeat protein
MSFESKSFYYLSITTILLIFMVFPLSANAQNGITTNPDLNGDGKSDLIWYNSVSGQTVAWLMDGTTAASTSALLSDPNWKIIKTADFNGDGMADLLWYNASTGETAAWLMNGSSVSAWTVLITDPDWKVIEAADFNGDGKTDLLWYNASSGQTAAWLMNGTNVSAWTVLITDPDWRVTAAADLNGDGKADLLWHNKITGQTAAWIMNGTSVSTWTVLISDPDWNVIGTADLNGDGMADLLWYNATTGQTAAWLMNGTSTTAWSAFPTDSNWKVVAAADLNGDGKADLLWRNKTTGQTTAWLMNGTERTAMASLMSDPNWAVTASADLNGDGKADLLWYNTTTGQTSAWLMNGTNATSGANLFTDPKWKLKCIKSSSLTSTMACVDTMTNAASGLMPLNQAPLVNAGADQTITLPALANLSGNASDDGAPIALLTSTWSQISGPGSVTFGNSANLRTTAAFSDAGTYTLRLTASDSALSTFDDVMIVVNGGTGSAPINKAPVVNAGPDQAVSLFSGANLLGSASDDGLPTGSAVSTIWSRISGPGAVLFGNASALTTSASFSTVGTYTLRLTATDSQLSSTDDVIIVVSALESTNQVPTVNAGPDQMITFPASASLTGTTVDDGLPHTTALTRTWSKVSGPGTVTFGSASALSTTATFSAAGSYTLRLTASRGSLSATDDVIIVVSPPAPTNQAPVVNAGADQTIAFPAGANLSGTASDDGLPKGSTLTLSWSKVSGPGSVVFVNANSLNSSVTFLSAGTYTLRLTASDGTLSTSDDVVIVVNANTANQAPIVNAGADQVINLPASATLTGTATDDGLPTGGTLTKSWSKVSGPGTVTFGSASSLSTTAKFSAAGTYTLRLTASDSSLASTDTVVITVNLAVAANRAPIVNAGVDQTISMPAAAVLAGTATDDGLPTGSSLTKTWSKVSGPGAVVFVNANSLNATATFMAPGTYTLRLTVSDGSLSSSDDVVVAVNSCGTMVSGTVAILANASDNVGVAGVQAQLDGANIGPYLTSAPYSVAWNTTAVPNGCHIISMTAQDAAGLSTTASLSVAVTNP